MIKVKKAVAFVLCAVMLLTASALTAYAADYSAQGIGGQTLTMLSPADITVNSTDPYYSNTINTALDCAEDIVFEFTLSAGMNNYTDAAFIRNNLPQISVYDSYGGSVAAQAEYVSGSSAGISISIPAGTLTDGTYCLVFGQAIQGNNSSKTLGKDIAFAFTAQAGGAPAAAAETASGFSDVPDWAAEYVAAMVENGCMSGVSETDFASDAAVTRGAFVTILGQARGIKAGKYTASVFSDVDLQAGCCAYAAWAAEKGIVNGYGNDRFGPDDVLTREQAATILYRYATVFSMDVSASDSLSAFSDAGKVSGWAEDAVAWAVGAGILEGNGAGLLAPADVTTRVETAKMIAVMVLGK